MSGNGTNPVDSARPLVIVGGYGLVGGQTAAILRARHPALPLVLAGRNPASATRLAASIDARTASIDVSAERPLAGLSGRPAAILATVTDPEDRLLAEAMREGIPIADIDRAEPIPVLDAMLRSTCMRPTSSVLLAGAWKSGTAALLAAALTRLVVAPKRIDMTVLISSQDRVGEGAWSFSRRWAWPHHVLEGRRRRVVHPFTDARPTRCADGAERTSVRISTLDQVTLPMTLDVENVEARFAMLEGAKLRALMTLKRTGVLRAFDWPQLRPVRRRLLERSGTGDLSGYTIAVTGPDRSLAVDVLDPRGQAHLGAIGAALAAERVLGMTDAGLPAGVSFPEQSPQPASDIAALLAGGVTLRAHGCSLEELARAGADAGATPAATALGMARLVGGRREGQ